MPFSDKNRQKAHNRFYYLVNKKGLTEEQAGEQVKNEMEDYKRGVPMNEMDMLLRAKSNNKMTTKQKIRYIFLTKKKEDDEQIDPDDKILNKLSSINNSLYYETDPERREKLIKIKNSLYEML